MKVRSQPNHRVDFNWARTPHCWEYLRENCTSNSLTGGFFGSTGIDTHNVYGYLIGGCGLLAFRSLVYRIRAVNCRFRRRRRTTDGSGFLEARKLLRFTMILFAVRGMFAAEILFSPCFCIIIGMGIGWATVNSRRWR